MPDSLTTVKTQQAGVQNALESLLKTTYGYAKTPAWSIIPNKPVDTPEYSWVVDKYAPRNRDNAFIEGADLESRAPTPVERLTNNAQISAKVYKQSGTLEKTGLYKSGSEEQRQALKIGVEIRRDQELIAWSTQARRTGKDEPLTRNRRPIDEGPVRKTASFIQFVLFENIRRKSANAAGDFLGTRLTQAECGKGMQGVEEPSPEYSYSTQVYPSSQAAVAAQPDRNIPAITPYSQQMSRRKVSFDLEKLLKLPERVARGGGIPNTIVCGADSLAEIYIITSEALNRRVVIEEQSKVRGQYFTTLISAWGRLSIVSSFAVRGWFFNRRTTEVDVANPAPGATKGTAVNARIYSIDSTPRVFCCQRDRLKARILRPLQKGVHGKTGDSQKFHLLTEWGLQQDDPSSMSVLCDLDV